MLRRRKKIDPEKKGRKSLFILWSGAALAVLVLAFAAPWNRFVNNFFHPYFALSGKITGELADRTLLLRSKTDLARAVETLSRENFALAARASECDTVRRENRNLRTLLTLRPRPGYR